MKIWKKYSQATSMVASIMLMAAGLTFATGCASTPNSEDMLSHNLDQNGSTPADDTYVENFEDPFEDPFADEMGRTNPDIVYRDPWESTNVKTFEFNRKFDFFFLKPAASTYDFIMPDVVQHGIKNVFTNLAMPRRFFNSIFQGKFDGAGQEFARFTINTTLGVGGLFDIASHPIFGIEPSNEDTGQTFAVWGADSGPYIVLPLLGASSVRDSIGLLFDAALEPLTYISFLILPSTAGWATYGGEVTNDRSLHLEAFDNVEMTSLDFYTSVQDAYFQYREAAIKQ